MQPTKTRAQRPIPGAASRNAAVKDRLVQSMVERTGASAGHVRALFAREFTRLELGATVRSFLLALTASRVRAKLRARAPSASEQPPIETLPIG